MKSVVICSGLAAAALLTGCMEEDVATRREREQTSLLTAQASTQVGMPALRFFTEKRNLKMIYELRDNPKFATIAYITDMQGKLHKRCDALGYGFPYSTQFTNPQRVVWDALSAHYYQLPQSEPNGLFMPSSAEGTWVLCLNPETKEVQPVYIEDRVTISPFPLKSE